MRSSDGGAIVLPYGGHQPQIAPGVFVAPAATVIGEVTIGPHSSVWFGAVLRGDVGAIRIGRHTNIQDHACVHMTGGVSNTIVGDYVTVGHRAVLHGCLIGNAVLVGIGAIVLDEATIGPGALVAAGALVPPRMEVPERAVVRGVPARVVGSVDDEQLEERVAAATHYAELAQRYLEGADP